MDPRLSFVHGPLKGKSYSVPNGKFCIGRDDSNQLAVNDPRVSRRHSCIEKQADRFKILDLNSTNGTFVNGTPVKERHLDHGDMITIGNSVFLFLLKDESDLIAASQVELDDSHPQFHSAAQLRLEDTVYLQDKGRLDSHLLSERTARDLHALLKISTAISSVKSGDALMQRLLELVLDVVPGQRGAVLIGEEPGSYSILIGLDKDAGPQKTVRVSRTIVEKVFEERQSILCNEVSEESAFKGASSLAGAGVQSVLCVPLQRFSKILGVLYIETTNPTLPFDENHLQFLTATAAVGAVALDNVLHIEWLENENRRLREDSAIEHSMVGESPAMEKVYEFIAKVAPSDSSVLITGENGTGKELVARAIHQNSPRAEKPFVAINCAALTETLLESELFGHEKGAFTGAVKEKKGKLEIAHQGTVLLDEIGELAPGLQAKLLRVLQERELERVGGTRPIKVDIRLVASTNKDLEKAMEEGDFRQDLYYRLNVISLNMPPLRERRSDIGLLARHFTQKYSRRCNRKVNGISREALKQLESYTWPGNVRELENAIERSIVLGITDIVLPEDLPESVLERGTSESAADTYHEALRQRKKELIISAVKQTEGNYTEAAKILDLHPNYLHRLIRNLELKEQLK